MTLWVVTPEVLKDWVDSRVEKYGVKAFVLSDEKDGTAHAPSKKVNLYRIPCAVYGDAFNDVNLGRVLNGSRLVLPITDLSWLSQESRDHLEKGDLHPLPQQVNREGP